MSAPRFTVVTSRAVHLLDADVDTDQIIPARFRKVTDQSGLADALVADWRARSSRARCATRASSRANRWSA